MYLYNPLNLEKIICTQKDYKKINENSGLEIFEKKETTIEKIKKRIPEKPRIKVMYMLLTDECNYACKYCFVEEAFESYPCNYMSIETAEKVIDFFLNCSEPQKIIFYGGEPFLNKKVLKHAIKKIRDKNKEISISIVTNGSLITEEDALMIKNNNIEVGISLDGKKEAHDKMRMDRGKNPTFEKTIKGWKTLEKKGVKPSASFTIGSHNIDSLEEHVKWICEELKPKAIGFNILNAIHGKENPAYTPIEKVAEKLIKAYEIMKKNNTFEDRIYARRITPFIQKKFWLKDCCGCGNEIAVTPEGMTGPCHGFISTKEYFQDKTPENEKEIERNKIWREWNNRSPINTDKCLNCAAIGICGGGCPYYSHTKQGSIWALDERSCILCNMTLTWLIKESYSKIKSKKIKEVYRHPMHGDENRFMEFIEKMKEEKQNLMQVEKLKPMFVTSMINLIAEKKAVCLFLEKNFEIQGFCNMIRQNEKESKVGIAVSKENRGKGKAKKLLELCMLEAEKQGIQKITAETHPENKASIKFFEKNDFKQTQKNGKIKLELLTIAKQ